MSIFPAVRPICLPDYGQDYDNVSALVTGWGWTTRSGSESSILQEVKVATITRSQCGTRYGYHRITENMICTEPTGDLNVCWEFGGGPLAVRGPDGSYSQIGIVSWGRGCGGGYPWVYTRITALLPWLTEMIEER